MARVGELDTVDEDVIKVSINKSVRNVREVDEFLPWGIDSRPISGLKAILFSLREKTHKIIMGIQRRDDDRWNLNRPLPIINCRATLSNISKSFNNTSPVNFKIFFVNSNVNRVCDRTFIINSRLWRYKR